MIAGRSDTGLPAALELAPIADPTLLALDCAGSACSVAVWHRARVAAHRFAAMAHGQGERLLPMVAEAMTAAALDFARLDAVAVTVGPGSFTGLRIGLAAAQGFGLALDRRVLGVTSFAVVAAGLSERERQAGEILVALDTRREDLFVQRFDHALGARGPARLMTPGDLAREISPGPLVIAGDGAGLLEPLLSGRADILWAGGSPHADAVNLAALAARLLVQGGRGPEGPALAPRPFYLRAPDAKLPVGGLVVP